MGDGVEISRDDPTLYEIADALDVAIRVVARHPVPASKSINRHRRWHRSCPNVHLTPRWRKPDSNSRSNLRMNEVRQEPMVVDSPLEGDGFELLVPPRRNSPRARHVVSAHGSTSSERH